MLNTTVFKQKKRDKFTIRDVRLYDNFPDMSIEICQQSIQANKKEVEVFVGSRTAHFNFFLSIQ